MEDRNELSLRSEILRWLILGIFFLFGPLLLIHSFSESMRYMAVKPNALCVIAETYTVTEEHGEDGKEYRVHMKYEYEGKTYSDSYKTYEKLAEAEAMIGYQVEIFVNPSDPSEQLEDIEEDATFYCLVGGILFGCEVCFLLSLIKKRYTEVYGWYTEYIEKDMRRKHLEEAASWMGVYATGVCYLSFLLVFPDVIRDLRGFNIAAWVLGTVILVRWLVRGEKVRRGKYRCTRQTLLYKKTEEDDNRTFYNLYYSEKNLVWHRSVSEKRYNAAQPGETVEAVFLEGEKKPFLVYDYRENQRSKEMVEFISR